jgi:hypothetical protein
MVAVDDLVVVAGLKLLLLCFSCAAHLAAGISSHQPYAAPSSAKHSAAI